MTTAYESRTQSTPRGGPNERTGRALMALAAMAAAIASLSSIGTVADAGPETRMVETWRMAGLATFAGLFALLAYRPMHYAGLWELVILNKLILTVVALAYGSGTEMPWRSPRPMAFSPPSWWWRTACAGAGRPGRGCGVKRARIMPPHLIDA